MTIAKVRVSVIETSYSEPILGSGHGLDTVLVAVESTEGVVGLGYGWAIGTARTRSITASVEQAATLVVGADECGLGQLWLRFYDYADFLGRQGLTAIGMSIIDMAIWDLRLRTTGMTPGRARRSKIHCACLSKSRHRRPIGKNGFKEVLEAASAAAEQGHTAFKLQIGLQSLTADIDRIRDLVASAEESWRFTVDAAQRWRRDDTWRACSRPRRSRIAVDRRSDERPRSGGNRQRRQSIETPVCVGENAYLAAGAWDVLLGSGCRHLMLDLQRCGGITGWTEISALSSARCVPLTTHTYPNIAVNLHGHGHRRYR